ncbi:hypothetical protein PSY31_24095, partial [Shigella flexneri]|nr:hypothetical protein [Shigella flexneri]
PKNHVGKRRFLFESLWVKEEQCGEIVQKMWSGYAAGDLLSCLNSYASELSSWNRNVIGHVPKKLANAKH